MATKPRENPKGPDAKKAAKGPDAKKAAKGSTAKKAAKGSTAKKAAKGPPAAGKTQAKPPEVKPKEPPPPPVAGQKSPAEDTGYIANFKKSNKQFWYTGHAQLKILTLGCLMTAYTKFSDVNLNPVITDVILMEASLLIFFLLLHFFALNRYLTFILWPVSDIINGLSAIVFLLGITILAVEEGKPFSDTYLASVILLGVAIFLTTIDTCLQYRFFNIKYMKGNFLVAPQRLEKNPKK